MEGLRASEARYRALFENMSEAMKLLEVVRDEAGVAVDWRVLEVNPAFERALERPRRELVGRLASDLWGPDPVFAALCGRVIETGLPERIDAHVAPLGKDFEVSVFPVGGGLAAAFGTDVTARRRAEADRERLLGEREELVRTISHDLRTPLAAIGAQAQFLAKRTGDDWTRARARAIDRSARRMNGMIQDLVDVARFEGGLELALEELEPAGFVAELLGRLAGGLDVERIRVVAEEPLPGLRADAAKLERVLVNLLTNALKYSPAGAPVTVRIRAAGGELEFAVEDRGQGIPPGDLPRVFDRFFRSGRVKGEGLGLGLHIARRLVEAHGGAVAAESAPGRGSTFRVRLPLAGPPPGGSGA